MEYTDAYSCSKSSSLNFNVPLITSPWPKNIYIVIQLPMHVLWYVLLKLEWNLFTVNRLLDTQNKHFSLIVKTKWCVCIWQDVQNKWHLFSLSKQFIINEEKSTNFRITLHIFNYVMHAKTVYRHSNMCKEIPF